MSKHVRITVDLSLQANAAITGMALTLGITKAEVLRRAIVLLDLATEAMAKDEHLALVAADGRVIKLVVL